MKTLSTNFVTHLMGENTNLATFWKIARLDNVVQGFTNYDKDIIIDGVIYKAATGFNSTAFNQDNTLAVRNLEIESIISSDSITEADLIGGKYDYAAVDVFICRWDSPPSSLSLNPPQHILMVRGIMGQISMSNRRYNAEVRSISQLLQQQISTITTIECRAVFGDSKCTKNLLSITDELTITAVTNNLEFTVNSLRPNGFYDLGEITFNSGDNNGIKAMILSYANGVIQLFESLPYPLAVGDTLIAITTSLTDGLTITAVTNNRQFTVNSSRANGFYDLGEITFNSGNNNGIKAMVLSYSSGVIQLFESLPYPLVVGNTLIAIAGCNKTVQACRNFNNIINYQGEPHIPGEDKFLAGFDG